MTLTVRRWRQGDVNCTSGGDRVTLTVRRWRQGDVNLRRLETG